MMRNFVRSDRVYARAGALDDAERELEALSAQNPDSVVVRALLDDVKSARNQQ